MRIPAGSHNCHDVEALAKDIAAQRSVRDERAAQVELAVLRMRLVELEALA